MQVKWNLADGKSLKSCFAYMKNKIKFRRALQLSLLRETRSKSAKATPDNVLSAPDFIQNGSISAEL